MSATDSQSVFDLFCELIDVEPGSRAARMEALRADRPDLAREVRSLLRAHGRAKTTFLVRSALDGAAEALTSGTDAVDLAGRRVGPWELLREIGRGGMGSVWLGERADGEFAQTVAIKMLAVPLAADDIIQRFRTERQVLANLSHPNIARLIDGGTFELGEGVRQPYLVMEYIDGVPIDDFCDRRRLSVRQRIEIFLDVCAAVQHAHRNLVVHRDLKPGNVLVETVDDAGARRANGARIKLLDFGVAKVLQSESPGFDATVTQQQRLTPAFASPEQIRGEPITTASDVYSLGVILYELLSGRWPYRAGTLTRREVESAVCNETPQRPADAAAHNAQGDEAQRPEALTAQEICDRRSADTATLRRELSGDLENILLTALRKEPERRYDSAAALADDLRRYLNGEPVAAHADSRWYRLRKFVGRNRLPVAAAATAITILIAAAIFSTVMFLHAREAQHIAETKAATAMTINSYLEGLIESIDPAVAKGRDVSVLRDVLDQTSQRIWRELDESPNEASALHLTMGVAWEAIGDYTKAERHLRESVRLRAAHGPPLDYAASLIALGELLRTTSEFDEASTVLRRAMALRRQYLGDDHPLVGEAMRQFGLALHVRGDNESSERTLREAIEILRRTGDSNPQYLAFALQNLGHLLTDLDRAEEAQPLLLEARDLLIAEYDDLHPSIARIEATLGWCVRRSGDLESAAAHYRRSLAIREAIYEPDHPEVAGVLTGLGAALEDSNQFDDAERCYERALEIERTAIGVNHLEYATVSNNLGNLYRKTGRNDEAIPLLKEAVRVYRDLRGSDDLWVSFPLGILAYAYEANGAFDDVVAAAEECLRIRRLHWPEDHWRIAVIEVLRASVLSRRGVKDEAERNLLNALRVLEESRGPNHTAVRDVLRRLVAHFRRWGMPERAREYESRLAETDEESAS